MRTKRLLTKAELALMLTQHGYGKITNQQIWAWYNRRENNGFPEMEGYEERRRGVRDPVFDGSKVLRWRRSYVPSKGGRPRIAA